MSETAAWNPMVRPSPKWWCRLLQRTGLTSQSHLLSRRRISVFGHVARLDVSSTSTYHSTDFLTARGVAHLVVHGTTGSTSYETIPPVQLESAGGVLSTVDMVVQRRDGPRRLRDDDDDDDGHWLDWQLVTFAKYYAMRFQVIKSQRQWSGSMIGTNSYLT